MSELSPALPATAAPPAEDTAGHGLRGSIGVVGIVFLVAAQPHR